MFRTTTTHSSKDSGLPRAPCLLLAISMCLTTLSGTVRADIVTDRFVCAVGYVSRSIELTFLDGVNTVPCEIRETREDGQTRTLWRATFDLSFCQRQMDNHRIRLLSLGWPCESVPVDNIDSPGDSLSTRALRAWEANSTFDQPIANPVNRSYSSVGDAAQPRTVNLRVAEPASVARAPAGVRPLLQFDGEVVLYEDSPSTTSISSEKPLPPIAPTGHFNSDDISRIDDWLIYLSAQSMASIRQTMGDQESFNAYQIAENLNSDNIYSRLQNRIEFLQSLLQKQ